MTDTNQCSWQPQRTNTYMDGTVGAQGKKFYQTEHQEIKIRFIFAHENIIIIGNSERRVLKVN